MFESGKRPVTSTLPERRRITPLGSRKIRSSEFGNEHTAIPVKNKVLWANKDFSHVFPMKEGKRSEFGMMLTTNRGAQDGREVYSMQTHNRSALLMRGAFKDAQGRIYRDVDLKGTGYIDATDAYAVVRRTNAYSGSQSSYGICDWGYAERDRRKTEYFLEKGMRTHRTVAIIALKEIVDIGERVPLKKAFEKQLIRSDEEPVIQVRAYGTKARIVNAGNMNGLFLEDAIELVGQELRKKMTTKEYMQWFAETLGTQVGILHSAGNSHRYLTDHNITLDCRITDLDSVGKFPKERMSRRQEALDDTRKAASSLKTLSRYAGRYDSAIYGGFENSADFESFLYEKFYTAYKKGLNKRGILLGDHTYKSELKQRIENLKRANNKKEAA